MVKGKSSPKNDDEITTISYWCSVLLVFVLELCMEIYRPYYTFPMSLYDTRLLLLTNCHSSTHPFQSF